MPGKKRTPTERAVIYAGVLGGLSLEQINKLLEPLDPEGLNPNSYAMLRDTYFDSMLVGIGNVAAASLNEFGESIYHPKRIIDL